MENISHENAPNNKIQENHKDDKDCEDYLVGGILLVERGVYVILKNVNQLPMGVLENGLQNELLVQNPRIVEEINDNGSVSGRTEVARL